MAEKKVGPLNIDINANSQGVTKEVAKSKKEIKGLSDAAKQAGGDAAKAPPVTAPDVSKAKKEFSDFDRQIKETISNLYRLRADGKKGVDISAGASQVSKQLDKIIAGASPTQGAKNGFLSKLFGGGSVGGGDNSRLTGQILGKIGGGTIVPRSLVGSGPAIAALGTLAVAKAVSTIGVINQHAYERDSTQGRVTGNSALGFGGYGDGIVNVAESLPVVGGLIKSLKTDLMDAFSSVNQETDIVTKAQEAWVALEEKRNALKEANKQLERETASIITHGLLDNQSIGDSTGVAGRSHQIERNAQGAIFDAGQKRDAGLDSINKERSEYVKDFQAKTKELKNLIDSSSDKNVVATAQSSLIGLNGQKKAFEQGLKDKQGNIGKQYDASVQVATDKAKKLQAINEGLIPDLDGINALGETVTKTIRDMPVDEIDGLRKQFAELHPDPKQLEIFNGQLDDLKRKQDQIEGQKVWKALTDDLKNYGLTADEVTKKKLLQGGVTPLDADNAIYKEHSSQTIVRAKDLVNSTANGSSYQTDKENLLSQLGIAGVGKEDVARVKLALDTKDAGEQYKQFKQQLQSIEIQLKVENAGNDEKARRHAEIDAEADKDLKGVTDPKLIAARRAEAETLKGKQDELDDKKKGNELTNDADTKDKYQRQVAEIGDLLKKGLIDDKTAQKEIGKTKKDYDDANFSHVNPDLMDIHSGAFQRTLLDETTNVTDSANPELAEAKTTNKILADIKAGLTPQLANF